MNKFDADWVSPEDMRDDVHPLAVLDTEDPIMECAGCGLPVPMELKGTIYCCPECEDKALDEALLAYAAEEAVREAKGVDVFAQLFPQIVAAPEPCDPFIECSCPH